jgi:hypothetical protein
METATRSNKHHGHMRHFPENYGKQQLSVNVEQVTSMIAKEDTNETFVTQRGGKIIQGALPANGQEVAGINFRHHGSIRIEALFSLHCCCRRRKRCSKYKQSWKRRDRSSRSGWRSVVKSSMSYEPRSLSINDSKNKSENE